MYGFLSRYGLAVHLALLAVAPLFLSPISSLYLSFLVAMWILLEPSRIGSESLREARSRVHRRLVRDPLFWILLAFIIIAGIRAFNTGIAMAYDAETMKWSISAPMLPVFPAALDGAGLPNFSFAVVLFLVLLAMRHAMGRSARFAFLVASSLFAAIGAFVCLFLIRSGSADLTLLVKTELSNPSFLGPTFGFYLLAAIQGLAAAFERHWRGAFLFSMIGVSGTALGVFLFSPPLVALVFIGAALIVFLANFVMIRINLGNPTEFKFLVLFGLSLTMTVLAVLALLPRGLESLKLSPYLEDAPLIPVEWKAQFAVLSSISKKIWVSSPWIGGGLGSFSLNLSFAATSADWAIVSPTQTAPLSGYWMLLVERGALGAFAFAVVLVLLLITFVQRLWKGHRKIPHPVVVMGPLALIVALAEMIVDVSILRPEALIVLVSLFALSAHGFVKENSHG